jgi:putative ABC transport system permease protein
MVVAGAEEDLTASIKRLGADIVVFPWGTRLEELQGGHLMQITTSGWIPRSYVSRIGAVHGVATVSPQLYLATLKGTPYASTAEAYVVAFDPATDFALEAWVDAGRYRQLPVNHAVVGAHILDADGTGRIDIDGLELTLAGQLALTGTDLDETIFVSFETARVMNERARGRPNALIRVSPQRATTALVRVKRGENIQDVAAAIMDHVPGAISIESAHMLQAQRGQLVGLLTTVLGLAATIWALSVTFIGLVFTMTVHARRRQIGVLRALGSPQPYVIRSLAGEGALLGIVGGAPGVALAVGLALLLREHRAALDFPFAVPPAAHLAGLGVAALVLAILSVTLAALVPALKISRGEPAHTMRE